MGTLLEGGLSQGCHAWLSTLDPQGTPNGPHRSTGPSPVSTASQAGGPSKGIQFISVLTYHKLVTTSSGIFS